MSFVALMPSLLTLEQRGCPASRCAARKQRPAWWQCNAAAAAGAVIAACMQLHPAHPPRPPHACRPTYVNIEAPPSVLPPKKYCDITGYEAPYTDPGTRLRYASAPLFPLIRSLPNETVQAFLAVRGAQVVLK